VDGNAPPAQGKENSCARHSNIKLSSHILCNVAKRPVSPSLLFGKNCGIMPQFLLSLPAFIPERSGMSDQRARFWT